MTTLRQAAAGDAPAVAVLHRHVVRTSLPYLHDPYTAEGDQAFFRDIFFPANTVWVSEDGAQLAGYIGFHAGWIDHLFIHPDHQGRGVGPRLLDLALADGGERQLWTFQKNVRARRFYERRGFEVVRLTDGAGNLEREPDVLYRRPATSAT